MEPNLTKLNEKFSPKLRARVWQLLPYSGFKHLLQCCHHSQLLWEPELNGYCSHSQHIKIVVQVLSFQKQQIRLLLTTKPIVFEGKWWKCSSSSVNLLHLMKKKSFSLPPQQYSGPEAAELRSPVQFRLGCNDSLPLLQSWVTPITQMGSWCLLYV